MTADFKCIEMHGGKIQVWVKMCGNDRVSLTPICFGLTLSSALKQKQPPPKHWTGLHKHYQISFLTV